MQPPRARSKGDVVKIVSWDDSLSRQRTYAQSHRKPEEKEEEEEDNEEEDEYDEGEGGGNEGNVPIIPERRYRLR